MAGGQKTIVAELSRTIEGVKSGLEELQQSLDALQKSSTGWTQSLISGLQRSQSQIAETKRGFDQLAGTIQRASAVPGVISGARISQALGASTGQAGGAGGAGGGAQPFASQFARSAMSPLRYGLPMLAGAVAQLPFAAAGGLAGGVGGILKKLPIASRVMRGLGGMVAGVGANVARPVVEGAVHMGLGFGTQYIQQAMAMREQMERGGRFIGQNPGQIRGMAATGIRHGYDIMQTMGHRESIQRAIGGGGSQEAMIQAMGNRLRQPAGNLIGAAGALRAGGMDANAIVGVLQRIEGGVQRAGFGRETPAFMHRTEHLLQAISGFSQQQVAISGSISQNQTTSFQNLVQALSGSKDGHRGAFSPAEAARKAQQLVNIRMQPGGGAAGELFVQRALGFGSPNLEAQKRAAEELGINPNLVRRRNLFEMQQLREENPLMAEKLMRAQLHAEFPGRDMQGWILGKTLSNIGFSAGKRVLGALGGGMPNIAGIGGVEGAGEVGGSVTRGMMGIDPKMITVLNKYHKNLATLAGIPGGIEGITNLAEALRKMQMIAGTFTAATFTELFKPVVDNLNKYLDAQQGTLEAAIQKEVKDVGAVIKALINKILGKTGNGNPPRRERSDVRLKKDLVIVGKSPSGINIYDFQYIAQPGVVYRGVIAQELLHSHPGAVIWDSYNQHYRVDYDKIDVDFVQRGGYETLSLPVSYGYL